MTSDVDTCEHGIRMFLVVLYNLIIFPVTLASAYVLYKYILDKKASADSKKQGVSSLMFYSGLFFFVVIFIESIESVVRMSVIASNCYVLDKTFDDLNSALYYLQSFSVLLILFVKIYRVFKDTAFQLSKCVVYSVVAWFSIILLCFVVVFTGLMSDEQEVLLLGIVFQTSLLYSMWITLFFIFKLYRVYKSSIQSIDAAQNKLLGAITKNTILAVITLVATLLAIIIWMFVSATGTYSEDVFSDIRFITEFSFLLDVVTNFGCIVMTFGLFSDWYTTLCSRCDRCCKGCCARCVGSSELQQRMKEWSELETTAKTETETTTQTDASKPEEPMSETGSDGAVGSTSHIEVDTAPVSPSGSP